MKDTQAQWLQLKKIKLKKCNQTYLTKSIE